MEMKTEADSVAARYAALREQSGLSKKGFAESLGIHPVVSGDIELGKREPSRDVLVRLARIYGTDINWLLTGQHAETSGRPDGADGGNIVDIEFIRQEAAAGRGAEIAEHPETARLPVPRSFIAPWKPEKVRAVEVRGDSMTGIGLDDRDVVLFAPKTGTATESMWSRSIRPFWSSGYSSILPAIRSTSSARIPSILPGSSAALISNSSAWKAGSSPGCTGPERAAPSERADGEVLSPCCITPAGARFTPCPASPQPAFRSLP